MKRSIALLLVVGLMVSACAPALADDALTKLGRGCANAITSPLEIPKGMGDVGEEQGMFAGFTVGLFKGTANFVKRLLVGVYEVVTFPVPVPEGYKPILEDPEYFLQDKNY